MIRDTTSRHALAAVNRRIEAKHRRRRMRQKLDRFVARWNAKGGRIGETHGQQAAAHRSETRDRRVWK